MARAGRAVAAAMGAARHSQGVREIHLNEVMRTLDGNTEEQMRANVVVPGKAAAG